MLHLTFSMAPSIVFAPNIRRTQNTDTGRKTQTQLISALFNSITPTETYPDVPWRNLLIQGDQKFYFQS